MKFRVRQPEPDKQSGNPFCPGCDLRRAPAQFRDECGNQYRHCGQCRDKHPKLRKPVQP